MARYTLLTDSPRVGLLLHDIAFQYPDTSWTRVGFNHGPGRVTG